MAIATILIAIHVGVRIFRIPSVEMPLFEESLLELEEWYHHNEHVFYAEFPSLGGVGRERIVSVDISRRYDVILHRYEIGRYSFDQKINYLMTQVFPYSIHMIANRSLMRANVSFDSVHDILVVPSEEMSVIFIAQAEEYGYEIYPVRILDSRVIGIQATEEEEVHFFFTSHTKTETWESLNARSN